MALKCTNTSGPPASWVMKPKPFSPLNHFTVPLAIAIPSFPGLTRSVDQRIAAGGSFEPEGLPLLDAGVAPSVPQYRASVIGARTPSAAAPSRVVYPGIRPIHDIY